VHLTLFSPFLSRDTVTLSCATSSAVSFNASCQRKGIRKKRTNQSVFASASPGPKVTKKLRDNENRQWSAHCSCDVFFLWLIKPREKGSYVDVAANRADSSQKAARGGPGRRRWSRVKLARDFPAWFTRVALQLSITIEIAASDTLTYGQPCARILDRTYLSSTRGRGLRVFLFSSLSLSFSLSTPLPLSLCMHDEEARKSCITRDFFVSASLPLLNPREKNFSLSLSLSIYLSIYLSISIYLVCPLWNVLLAYFKAGRKSRNWHRGSFPLLARGRLVSSEIISTPRSRFETVDEVRASRFDWILVCVACSSSYLVNLTVTKIAIRKKQKKHVQHVEPWLRKRASVRERIWAYVTWYNDVQTVYIYLFIYLFIYYIFHI